MEAIIALAGSALTIVLGALVTVLFRRAFRLSDLAIKQLQDDIEQLDESVRKIELDLAGNTEKVKSEMLEKLENFVRRPDFIREIQQVSSTLTILHSKLDNLNTHFDNKIDSLREEFWEGKND